MESTSNEALGHERFRRSGRIDLIRSAPWLLVLAGVTVALSCLLAILFHVGGYLRVIVPIVAAFVLLIVMVPLVDRGHWRNPWAAALVGLLAGTTAYLGYYYLDMIWQVGSVSETATRLDLLPEFISLRMQSDVSESVGSGIPASHSPASPNAIVNWFTFCFELGLMALFPAVFGWLRSSRPFCESCGRWMDQSVVGYSPDAGPAIQSLAKAGDFERITSMPQMSLLQGHPATMLLVWHCDVSRDEPRACSVFLSVRRSRDGGMPQGARYRTTMGAQIRDRRLTPRQVAALQPVFPGLRPFADAERYAEISGVSERESRERIEARRIETGDKRIVITEFPDESILTGPNNLKAQLLSAVALISLFGGIGLVLLGVVMFDSSRERRDVTLLPTGPAWMARLSDVVASHWPTCPVWLAWLTLGAGVSAFVYSLYFAVTRMTSYRDRFYRRKAAEVVQRRSDAVAEPGGENTFFVEIVPQENWNKVKLETATDFGFLKCDVARRTIFFEGDRRRVVAPIAALRRLDLVTLTGPNGRPRNYVIHTEFDDGESSVSLPVIAFEAKWRSGIKYRLGAAASLHNEIANLYQPTTPPIARERSSTAAEKA